MIVEVEEVGRVVYTVRGLSSTNHQSPHAEHFLVQNGCSSAVISVHQRSGIFGSYPGTVPAVFSIRSAQIRAVFGDAKRDTGSGSLSEL